MSVRTALSASVRVGRLDFRPAGASSARFVDRLDFAALAMVLLDIVLLGCFPRRKGSRPPAGDQCNRAQSRGLIGASTKILYCCDLGRALSSSFTYEIELLPSSVRGKTITRMKRVGRSAPCANTGSGPDSNQAPPGP